MLLKCDSSLKRHAPFSSCLIPSTPLLPQALVKSPFYNPPESEETKAKRNERFAPVTNLLHADSLAARKLRLRRLGHSPLLYVTKCASFVVENGYSGSLPYCRRGCCRMRRNVSAIYMDAVVLEWPVIVRCPCRAAP